MKGFISLLQHLEGVEKVLMTPGVGGDHAKDGFCRCGEGTSPFFNILFVLITAAGITFLLVSPISAQDDTPCGVVDAITYPVESVESITIADGYDDFGLYRTRFGGNHVGIDVAFREQGEPVYAAARGLVTYADIEGWNAEGGVVILRHVFPDGGTYYTLYGHLEESDEAALPEEGICVELGDVIGAVGAPASSAPHLHYEIRTFLADDGGPGYTDGNPLDKGWFHPLDFTHLWRLRLNDGFVDAVTFPLTPSLPPITLPDGTSAISNGETVYAFTPPSTEAWRVNLDDLVNSMVGLPDSSLIVRTNSGRVYRLYNGRLITSWLVEGPNDPFVTLGTTAVFITADGSLAAYNPDGVLLWTLAAPAAETGGVGHLLANGVSLSVSQDVPDGVSWRVVDPNGAILYEALLDADPVVTKTQDNHWMALAAGDLLRLNGAEPHLLNTVGVQAGRSARMTTDLVGNTYLYTGDSNNILLSWDTGGGLRWQTTYPAGRPGSMLLPPMLHVDEGCLLYGLDAEGQMSIFNATDGDLVMQTEIYPGGDRSGTPSARVLEADLNGNLRLGAGFISLAILDRYALAEAALGACLLG